MLQTGWTTRLYVLTALFFALGVLLAPAWHAAQAATPADCCEGEGAVTHVEPVAVPADTNASCCCCPGDDETAPAGDSDAPAPDQNQKQEQEKQPEPCPTDGNCPCCKSMVIVSVAVPLPAPAASSISDEPRELLTAHPASPDSRGLATDPQPPKR